MAFGSMTELLGGGARLHRFYFLAVAVARDSPMSIPALALWVRAAWGLNLALLDFGLIVAGSGGGDVFVGALEIQAKEEA
jgi:hypothetical protein